MAVFEDKDWRRPVFALARNGMVSIVLPMLCFLPLCWDDGSLSWAGVLVLVWSLGAIVEGVLRCCAIASADSVARVEVRVDQVTNRVVQVNISASAFRQIKRVTVALLTKAESFDGRLRQVDQRVLPGGGRRCIRVAAYLNVGGTGACDDFCEGEAREVEPVGLPPIVRLTTAIDGCPDLIHDLPLGGI